MADGSAVSFNRVTFTFSTQIKARGVRHAPFRLLEDRSCEGVSNLSLHLQSAGGELAGNKCLGTIGADAGVCVRGIEGSVTCGST